MRRVELSGGRRLTQADLDRSGVLPADVISTAEKIVDDVRERGDAAVREYCLRFDGSCPEEFRVPDEVVAGALDLVSPEFLAALKQARDQIRDFHEREREQSWFTTRADGTMLGVKVSPVASAAVYVPGGRAQYPSTVLMDTIPAKVAGVERVVMVTPPQRDGSLSAYTLAAAALAGVDEVYAVGGAQAIAAVAYGTETIPAVEKIVGPGNAYVAAAKRYVSGDVGIDMVAGPSEVCVLADATADPVVVAADLMAQAEHDPMASCYLVTCDAELPERVLVAVERLVSQSPREKITRTSLDERGVIVVADSLDAAVDAVNVVAPEHLELHCEDAMALLGRVRNAGAIFVGAWSSEPLGDYVAGPNHTLPTGGTARWANPLGVYDFQKRSSVICYTPEGLLADAPAAQTLAQAEGLWAHALSVGLRRRIAEGGTFDVDDVHRVAWPEALRGDSPVAALGD
ncbi:histidinol dehydrogenase [Thermophilibacter provencensis]|uniref:Histidinol dehydrogenase n=1 Tax=Thermophilibacter provencensis TaxID=1852386 RepID=A0ABT7V1Z5_9ACTN|nr:histidinol dehydrogenase [Thermophilibacter provencensis]MDM8270612.1 histidinol dehydrogenase [Thermophilibacter provencensis]